jgi:hypothetical protein
MRQSSLCGLPGGQQQSSAILYSIVVWLTPKVHRRTSSATSAQKRLRGSRLPSLRLSRCAKEFDLVNLECLRFRRASYANRIEFQNALYISFIKISSVVLVSNFTRRLHTKTLILGPWLFSAFYVSCYPVMLLYVDTSLTD